ncbi:hypothetical protein KOW79_021786 [Hemibagrus wyckioides]|uniref:RING-type domain-containing protein n=1 Tax=Hemibagrus wyckioides TaxID=337641 RepID=A0A9D3N181_9TELE|nr:uncharacterized protein si:ch211-284e13.9 [Hemibagrus wyckioides]KAG7314483.1 hypothetical protein KOW79_021786 [Hemibagrus wyckioides]
MSHSTSKPKCPGCNQEVIKNSDGQCVACQLCSKKKRRVFCFCWDCQREWPRTISAKSICTQPNCALRAALLSDKRISDSNSSAKGCPYFRACPNCKALLTHNGIGCSLITCPKCSTEFCFRCLCSECTGFDLNMVDFELHRHVFNDTPQCNIMDNSQSLMSLR